MARYLAALILVLSLAPINASAESLWRLASPAQFSGELSTIKPPASISTDQVIEMSIENLHGLATGDVITLSFSDTQAFDFVLTGQISYVNGDKGWQAKLVDGDGFVMTLTYSNETVIASVYSPVGKYQLRAFVNPSDGSSYIGWLSAENPDVRYAPIDDGGYIPPQYSTRQSFLLSDQPIKSGKSVSALSGNDVSIVQTFSDGPVLIGETVDVSIEVKNNLASDITNEVLTVWFALDGAELVSSDSACSIESVTTVDGKSGLLRDSRVLNCAIAKIGAEGSANIKYTLRTTAQSYPSFSNAVFVGDWRNNYVRDDGYIDVVKDTLKDSDGDGISDFNENILGTDPSNSFSVIADNFIPTVDLMFFYTQRFLDDIGSSTPEIEINAMVQLANEQYANSGAGIEFRAVHYEKTDYVFGPTGSAAIDDLISHTDVSLQTIPSVRAAVGADMTILIDGLLPANATFCGRGTLEGVADGLPFEGELFHPSFSDKETYTVMYMPGKSRASNFTCSDDTLAHELGHNLGLAHSRRDSSSNSGTFAWSRGHGVDNSFSTIMASNTNFGSSSQLPLFSNPLITDCNGLSCGVSSNDLEQGADAVLSINTTRFQVANIRDSVVAFNVAPAVTISGGSRIIADTDNAAGESVSFTATATDSDGSIATTQWLVNGAEVATGLSATLALPDGSTAVTFKATDNDGDSATTTVTITILNANSAQVPQIERNALIELYNSANGANWKNNTGWLGAAGTECGWYGITCSSGSISVIQLNTNLLSGEIPSKLGNLTNLIKLNFFDNSLSGSIPAELGNLTELTSLSLNNNSLSGRIPTELSNLTKLSILNLDDNFLNGSIPAELGNLKELTILALNNNSLSGSIPPSLGNLTKLRNIYFYINSLSGGIPPELGSLKNLTYLMLNRNSLSGKIPSELGNLRNLVHLNLGDNSLAGIIPPELGSLTKLEYLYLEKNSFTGLIPSELRNLTQLRTFRLDRNFLTGPLPEWLTSMSIRYLNITDAFTVPPTYEPTVEWPAPYNGVTPDLSFGLEFNNVGVFSSNDAAIHVCLRVYADGLPSSLDGVSQFDLGLKIKDASPFETKVQITKSREFNVIGALNENGQPPDCSGIFETTTGVYTDIIQTDTSIFETTWSLIDPINLILKLKSYRELIAN